MPKKSRSRFRQAASLFNADEKARRAGTWLKSKDLLRGLEMRSRKKSGIVKPKASGKSGDKSGAEVGHVFYGNQHTREKNVYTRKKGVIAKRVSARYNSPSGQVVRGLANLIGIKTETEIQVVRGMRKRARNIAPKKPWGERNVPIEKKGGNWAVKGLLHIGVATGILKRITNREVTKRRARKSMKYRTSISR